MTDIHKNNTNPRGNTIEKIKRRNERLRNRVRILNKILNELTKLKIDDMFLSSGLGLVHFKYII